MFDVISLYTTMMAL